MEYIDFGARDEPVLLIGGSYSNAHATHAMKNRATAYKIADDHRIMTGDSVAHCVHPNETVDLIRGLGTAMVAGNCEKQLANEAQDCGCGFEEGSLCDRLSAGWFHFATGQLRTDLRRWMMTLPDIIIFSHQELRVAVIHGGISDNARFYGPIHLKPNLRLKLKCFGTMWVTSIWWLRGIAGLHFPVKLAL